MLDEQQQEKRYIVFLSLWFSCSSTYPLVHYTNDEGLWVFITIFNNTTLVCGQWVLMREEATNILPQSLTVFNIRLCIKSCNVMLNNMCKILNKFFREKEEKRETKETMAGQDLMAPSVLRYVYMSTLNNNFFNKKKIPVIFCKHKDLSIISWYRKKWWDLYVVNT